MVYIKVLISYGNFAHDSKLTAAIRHNGLVFREITRREAMGYFASASAVSDNKKPDQRPGKSHQYFISISSVLTTGADIEGDIVGRYVIAVI
ncbi:hypothetical protein GW643_18115 [Serratia marcescens]|uniref:hypothetical protein n=1 Tax=Serratia marcescens TaxID=615 RepID=UPI0013779162|nr:hypothetical protein [Serratia marcescens]NCJ12288.1 hypothetical protein [Serratia marcescens]NDJ02339.1 hypothetical protein [Serratia marcescens]